MNAVQNSIGMSTICEARGLCPWRVGAMNLIALPTTATSKFVLVLGPPQCDGGATLQLYVVKALVIV